MPRHEPVSHVSSLTSSSTDSGRSATTVKPLPSKPSYSTGPVSPDFRAIMHSPSISSRRGPPSRLQMDENGNLRRMSSGKEDLQVSPTIAAQRGSIMSPTPISVKAAHRENRVDFGNYRHDLAAIDFSSGGGISDGTASTAGSSSRGGAPQIPHIPSISNTGLHQVAPWMAGISSAGGSVSAPSITNTPHSTYYDDSSENVSVASPLSPPLRSGSSRQVQNPTGSESPEALYYGDERRPSIASVATASSQGSRASDRRGGGFRKLQGFFGEEYPGRDSSETSLNTKEQRSHSHSHGRPHRDRNYSNATDHTRDASPASSRPRTPVPAPEVVPFLYQEANDIVKYGEAPVRNILSGPDRDRYVTDALSQIPPKTSSSSRSAHSIAHMPHHRHNKSNDDPRSLRPTISREDSLANMRERANPSFSSARPRAQSPTPSGHSGSTIFGPSKSSSIAEGQISPSGHQPKRGILGRLRRHKDKDEGLGMAGLSTPAKLVSYSTQSLLSRPLRQELPRLDGGPLLFGSDLPQRYYGNAESAASIRSGISSKQATFNNKFPFSKKPRTPRHTDDQEEMIGPTDRADGGTRFYLDTDLNNMDGNLGRPLPLTPMDVDFLRGVEADKANKNTARVNHYYNKNAASARAAPVNSTVNGTRSSSEKSSNGPGNPAGEATGPNGAWNAPDSWAVRRTDELHQGPETDDYGSPPRPEEDAVIYCIRVFKSDGTFATLPMSLNASVQDMISVMAKRVFTESQNYQIVLKRHDLIRILGSGDRPLIIQKRLLQQVGYEESDHLGDLGREDNSYLCRFLFLTAHDSDFQTKVDIGLGRMPKLNHVDLSGRNLITIPISLYKKASDIMSLNLSRNLSLDVPRDFIQSCVNLRDIKYSNNEVRKLPPSLGRASRLTFLDVSNNRVENLNNAGLEEIVGILKLNMANNRLKQLPSYFGAYRSLRQLNISSNFLDKFPGFLCDMESLIDLDLSFNLIDSLPDEIGKLRNLEKFVITNNRLSGSLPVGFRQLESLRELDVKYNAITSIDVISDLPKLEILTADHNNISQFVGSFERLRTLKLNANPITRFEIKSPLPTLKLLNLSNAQLASIADSFNNIRNLERLHLDKNYFVSLPNQIGNLGRLETFSIANNSVGELPPEIGCLMELRVLDVRGNNIRKLPMELWWANKLETLNASSNVLDNFPKPASRPPQVPGEPVTKDSMSSGASRLNSTVGTLSSKPSSEELSVDDSRRPSQASSTLLSVGPSPVPSGPDRKSSVVSVYGKGGRKTSVVSRSTAQTGGSSTPTAISRKDSGLSSRITNTFAGSLRNLYLADNQLDDDVFEQLALLGELRVLNASYNEITDMPQRSMTKWPQLVELYLSGNELTTLPADDLGEYSMLQVLHINNNKFTNLPADISRAKKLAVLDCGNNSLKYNISNVPYDWNWNLNPNLRYLNLSGNRRLDIKQTTFGSTARPTESYTDFNRLLTLRVLGLMDVTLTQPSVPDQSEDRRVRTSGSMAGFLPYGMADTLGKNEHLSTIDLITPQFSSNDGTKQDTLLCLFDGQALSSGGSKIAKYLHENFGRVFLSELKVLKPAQHETVEDALRRAFLTLNKDLVTSSIQADDRMPLASTKVHRGSVASMVMTKEDLNSGGVATVVYLQGQELYVANVGDAQAMLIQSDSSHKILTRKHDPAEPSERSRIRDAGGWVSHNGRLNDMLEVSRAFGYADLMPAVMAAPHVTHWTVREQDETVVIATRELWEYLTPGLVVDIARQERGDLMRAAQKLRDLAMAYGASGKIMVMMLSIADLKRKAERSRLHRGQSMSLYPLSLQEETSQFLPTRRGKRTKGEVLDSTLQRLEAEVPAPTGLISIVFTDIKSSTNLWETYPAAMRSAIKLHNEVMRRQLRLIGGFEVKTEGDAFMVSFPTATSALLWAFVVQLQLLEVQWPTEMLNSTSCQEIMDKDNNVVFRGLSVRMGIHWGEPLCEPDPITRRMDYYGPMVNKASRISSVADGGQITVSSDFVSEIQRCLETYQESPTGSIGSSEDPAVGSATGAGIGGSGTGSTAGASSAMMGFDDDVFAQAIRKELRALSSQGFEVKEMGEIKLKGLENPEVVYSLYPHALAGRMDAHQHHERLAAAVAAASQEAEGQAAAGPVMAVPKTINLGDPDEEVLRSIPEAVWGLWRVSLRLEMLCSSLEEAGGCGLQPPGTELLEQMKQRGANVTEEFMISFFSHQVSRIETCVTTLTLRHMAIGGGPIGRLDDLRGPMADVFASFQHQLAELQQYRTRYGSIELVDNAGDADDAHDAHDDDEGSDTEQE
ncbi:adenylate cyclase [Grosmannia clavigera kw1407]|uniref:Adenylate cyclase n=1 Tax=Grosmannia clavigera (strain kw1407 / UAMH 11150) TaxID=655863 RepID=F0XRY0_GROCL|nr:adenylate cyclase [Grosmannia clavigera kw1407]EFW99531.1 adenylate cyclase [Grosmannia clavigera kw1407]